MTPRRLADAVLLVALVTAAACGRFASSDPIPAQPIRLVDAFEPALVRGSIFQDRFCVAGTYRTIAERVGERLGGIVDRVSLPLPVDAADRRDEIVGAVKALQALPTARERRAAPTAR